MQFSPPLPFLEGRQIQAGCTCLENRIGSNRGRSITDAFRQPSLAAQRRARAARRSSCRFGTKVGPLRFLLRAMAGRPILFLTLNERKSYATRYPLPKPIALSQELQTKPNYPNPTGHEAELHFSSDATVRFEAAIGTRLVAQEQSARLISGRPRSVTARDDHPFACRLRLGRPISPGS